MIRLAALAVSAIALRALGAQQATAPAPYILRGRQVEAKQRALSERVQQFHDQLADVLRREAPDLLPRLEPPASVVTGYQLLPRIVPDVPTAAPTALQLVSYSWTWSETLMRREDEGLTALGVALSTTAGASKHATLDSIVTEYRKLTDRKKLVDADVNYNWLWQAAIARTPAPFERASRLSQALLERHALRDSIARDGLGIPGFVRFIQNPSGWTIIVPIVTDIADSLFLQAFTQAVEDNWRVRTDKASYAVKLDMRPIPPRALYCGPGAPSTCAAPARGSAIDLQAHLARFPPNVAILTTGAGSTHVTAVRAIVLSPHDAPRRMLAHEFGHLLGFRDAYLRGARDAGEDGYIVTELVIDQTDIMGNSKSGTVRASHFERLLAAREVPALMQQGLDAFYVRHDPMTATARFREVLQRYPDHYGATFQLAKALDVAGKVREATAHWSRVLAMAQEVGDTATARQARAALGRR